MDSWRRVLRAGVVAGGLGLAVTPVWAVDPIIPQPKASEPILGLTEDELARFELGRLQFTRTFEDAEGLGPGFNQDSCDSCHSTFGAGGPGNIKVTRFGMVTKEGFDPLEELGGSLLQSEAISEDCLEVVPEGAYSIQRLTNSIFGDGLIEAIPDADLLALEAEPPGISGRAHIVQPFEDPETDRVGRFGWKAQVATMLTFSADAALNEMGITNRFVTSENAPNGDLDKLAMCDVVPDPEDIPDGEGVEFIDRVTDFQRFLAPPPQTPKSGMTGEQVFNDTGCNSCHVSSFTSGTAPEAALSNVTFRPYSDFLLHDMGLLGDGIVQGDATELEIRTPPLWGLRMRDPMLHDGRSGGGTFEDRVTDAILQHSSFNTGEANEVVDAFIALSSEELTALFAFLDSLGRPEFDHTGDNRVDGFDHTVFASCFTGPGDFYTPDDACAISDIDQDGDVDCYDFQSFKLAFSDPQWCDGDVNGDGAVDPLDSGAVLARFGLNPEADAATCQYDANADGVIDPLDAGFVQARFGACE